MEKCDRCKKGYSSGVPKEDVQWPVGDGDPWRPGEKSLRVAKCARCASMLLDYRVADKERENVFSTDVCVVNHLVVQDALVRKDPRALAAVSPQLRRRHAELLVAAMPMNDRQTLEAIERGAVDATEAMRGLITRRIATSAELPPINDVRMQPRTVRSPQGAVGPRTPIDMGDGSRVMLESLREQLVLVRMRGDAVLWRTEVLNSVRDGYVARVQGRDTDVIVLTAPTTGQTTGTLLRVSAETGEVQARGEHHLRPAGFEARALPANCTLLTSYQAATVVRSDGETAWHGHAAGVPTAVPVREGVAVIDAPWRLVVLELPSGRERWALPIDRSAQLSPSGEGCLLVMGTDSVTRLDVDGDAPKLVWTATGNSALPLANGGVALVKERWEKHNRVVECVVLDGHGRRRFTVPRPESTKVPVAELGSGVLLFHSTSEVAVSVQDHVTYALSLPENRTVYVVVEPSGAWIEYDGVVDKINHRGERVGRWRVDS